ncbi:uncharacterized protein KGF55_000327 [Candida pseudojiufengensis]|uniref:uncharacterized protein n=1 Tax=Candida pseudojiufengensis TaxID=497109 RepID=UPI0022250AB2|nr:uncharacterized protein KGF55_000327 [Candida pseudojiufengensis]KAI5966918.1 hypothetical protein KGF55_000327 [Candida pseudojiufengensis]
MNNNHEILENLIFIRDDDLCLDSNPYNGKYFIARITAVPVLFVVSAIGSFAPLIAKHNKYFRIPGWCFQAIKFFGSGVIIATGFIHLMAESSRNLTNICLGSPFVDYPFAEGIALIALFLIFFFDVIAHHKLNEKAKRDFNKMGNIEDTTKTSISTSSEEINNDNNTNTFQIQELKESHISMTRDLEALTTTSTTNINHDEERSNSNSITESSSQSSINYKQENERNDSQNNNNPRNLKNLESLYQQILNCIVLECGIVLHSIFVGLSLAIAGDEFITLYIAICFHQMFEGLGLGTRFATTPWPQGKKYIPWVMSLAYSFTTPFACGIGLIVRESYPPGSRTALITTGVFDAACAGILIYNSIAELMAYDFMYSGDFENKSINKILVAFFYLTLGAFAMALIGKWA